MREPLDIVQADVPERDPTSMAATGNSIPAARSCGTPDLEDICAVRAQLELDRYIRLAGGVVDDLQTLGDTVGADQPFAIDADRPADQASNGWTLASGFRSADGLVIWMPPW